MYSLNLPVSTLRTKIRQEFERHRYVNQLKTVDVLLFSSHQEYQVRLPCTPPGCGMIHSFRSYRRKTEHHRLTTTGNLELLEAAIARAEVLPRRGRAKGEATKQLHQWILGGKGSILGDPKTC